ncbi:MAG: competence protein ComEC [Planctomycetota bacterium]
MAPIVYRSLAEAIVWSLPTAVLASICLPIAAAIAMAGILVASCTQYRWRRSGLSALPVLLAAVPASTAPLPAPEPGPVWVEGRVRDVVRAPLAGRNYVQLAEDLRIAFPGEIELVAGDKLRVLARAGEPAIPGVRGALQAIPATMKVEPCTWSFRSGCAQLRRAMERELLRLVPGEHGAMLATLVLGRATRPDPELAAAHRATGLSHLLAVSGAHAAMLAFLLGLSSRGRHLGAGRTRSAFVLAILLIYGGIAGAEPPVLRAVVAYTLAAIAARIGRPFGIATGLLVPAWITCLVEPEALLSPSFLLSYAAVTGLAMALRGRPPETLGEWLFDGLRASFWATLLTAPLTLGFFGQLAPWTILLTPLCAPLVAMMLLVGLIAASLAMVAPGLADFLAWPLHAMASTYAWLVHTADHLPGTPIPAWYRPPPWAIALVGAICVAFVFAVPRKRSVVIAVFGIVTLWFLPLQERDEPHFTLFAVGHGQAALANTEQLHQIVIDCGSLQGGSRAARLIDGALTRCSIDLLVITHADTDHHNGVPFLLQRLHVRRAMMPASLDGTELHALLVEHGCEIMLLKPGEQSQPLPSVRVLAPDLPIGASDNNLSLWMQLQILDCNILLTGDAQELGTAAALASGFVTRCDVVVLPHHGRRNANAPHLLRRARPHACLASATTGDGQTLQGDVARAFGAKLWSTGLHGTIMLRGDPIGITSLQPSSLQPRPARSRR